MYLLGSFYKHDMTWLKNSEMDFLDWNAEAFRRANDSNVVSLKKYLEWGNRCHGGLGI